VTRAFSKKNLKELKNTIKKEKEIRGREEFWKKNRAEFKKTSMWETF